MDNKLQPVRGTKDLLPDDYKLHDHIIKSAEKISENYGYMAMNVPIFEFTEIFKRTLGDSSDVVSKEMYTFTDRGGESITLRPEFTAGIARSVISNGLFNKTPFKFFSHGPLFRYERPQKGRFRQLHQINFESFGYSSPFVDSELIDLIVNILDDLKILDHVTLELNSLGDKETRDNYRTALFDYLKKYESDLSEDSKIRLYKNPLRILDSKDENDRKIISDAPIYSDYYNDSSKKYFDSLQYNLTNIGIDYKINNQLVRGLDYYSHTVFEFTTSKLGAQGSIGGGGRYDGLIELMCGKYLPSVGFASGIERIAALIDYNDKSVRPLCIIPIGNDSITYCLSIAQYLRKNNIKTEIAYNEDIGKNLKFANKISASYAIFIGSDEIASSEFKIRNLDERQEEIVHRSNLLNYFL